MSTPAGRVGGNSGGAVQQTHAAPAASSSAAVAGAGAGAGAVGSAGGVIPDPAPGVAPAHVRL